MSAEFKFHPKNALFIRGHQPKADGRERSLFPMGEKTPNERSYNLSATPDVHNALSLSQDISPRYESEEITDTPLEIPKNWRSHRVGMNKFTSLSVPDDDTNMISVKTESRSGCDAILLWRKNLDGSDDMLVTHFPPRNIDQHREAVKNGFPDGEGEIHAVLVTVADDQKDWAQPLIEDIEERFGITPDIVRLPMPTDKDMRDMQSDKTAYQLSAVKRYADDPTRRRISVPIPFSKGYVYEKEI